MLYKMCWLANLLSNRSIYESIRSNSKWDMTKYGEHLNVSYNFTFLLPSSNFIDAKS